MLLTPERLTYRTLSGDRSCVLLLDIRSRLPCQLSSIQAAYLGTFCNNAPIMPQYGTFRTPLDPKTPRNVPLLVSLGPFIAITSVVFRPVWSRVGGRTSINDNMAGYG